VVLIERTNRAVMLTPVGVQIVAQAQRVLKEVKQLEHLAEQHKDPLGGEFRLGIIPTVAPYLLPRILAPIRDAFPNLRISLTEAQTKVVTPELKNGLLDAAILALPAEDDSFVASELYVEPFYFAVSPEHAKANLSQVTLADLEGEDVLLLEDGHCLRDQALEVCNSHNAVENTNFRATSIETLRQMVAANVGSTLIPQLALGSDVPDVRYIPFKGTPPHRRIGLCWRSSSTRSELLNQLSKVLRGLALLAG